MCVKLAVLDPEKSEECQMCAAILWLEVHGGRGVLQSTWSKRGAVTGRREERVKPVAL